MAQAHATHNRASSVLPIDYSASPAEASDLPESDLVFAVLPAILIDLRTARSFAHLAPDNTSGSLANLDQEWSIYG